jgi:hypothetical protein
MHDPMTVAFDIPNPFARRWGESWFSRPALVTIWHVDPEADGSDDSCGWCFPGRPWWRHPRWHVHHWKIQVHPLQMLNRWLFSRCATCGKGFGWGYAPVASGWHPEGPRWFRSEEGVRHHECAHVQVAAVENRCTD